MFKKKPEKQSEVKVNLSKAEKKQEEKEKLELTKAQKKEAEKQRKKEEELLRKKQQKAANKKKGNISQETANTIQSTIPYRKVYKNGIIETAKGVFTKSYALKDINYQIAQEDDQITMFVNYCKFLNSFDTSVKIQVTINNRNIDKDQFEADTLLAHKGNHLDKYIDEYNDMLVEKMSEGKNNMTRDRYVTVAVEAESYTTACSIFARLDTDIPSQVKKIGDCEAKVLNTGERLKVLHDLLNVGHENEFHVDENVEEWLNSLAMRGLDTKDVIIPDGIQFKGNHMIIGDKYARVLYLNELPTQLTDNVLSELTDSNFNMITSLNLAPMPQDQAVKIVRHQITNINSSIMTKQQKAAKDGVSGDLINPDLKKAAEDAHDLLNDLTSKNQKMFLLTMVIMHYADSLEQLDRDSDSIITIGRKYVCQIKKLGSQQELGFKSVLPLCYNQLYLKRTLTTESTAVLIPFTSQEMFQKGGTYYGLNAISRNIILFNRESCHNGNGFVLGTPGSGKSFTVKGEIVNIILNTDDDVIIIDPENEYRPLVDIMGGEVVSIKAGGKYYINPLDMDAEYAGENGVDPISLKVNFMLSVFKTIIGKEYTLTPSQKSIVNRAVKQIYREYIKSEKIDEFGKKTYDTSKLPNLTDLQKFLGQQREREALELALDLELFSEDGFDNFAHYTNVDTENRLLCYDIRDVGTSMMDLAMLVVMDSVWQRILKNHRIGKKTWVYIDEAHLLFNNEVSADFLNTLYKRSRKFNGYITSITQNVEDILKSDICRTMISNAHFNILLNQATIDRNQLAILLKISDTQLSHITGSAPGEGLLIANQKNIIPFINKFPENTDLYKAMTTKPSDVKAYKELMKKKEAQKLKAQ